MWLYPEELRKELEKPAKRYADAMGVVDLMDGESFEFSARQAKVMFNGTEMIVGGLVASLTSSAFVLRSSHVPTAASSASAAMSP